jgi:hypothetical protein
MLTVLVAELVVLFLVVVVVVVVGGAGDDCSWRDGHDCIYSIIRYPLSSACIRISRNVYRRAEVEAEVRRTDEKIVGGCERSDIAMRPHGHKAWTRCDVV